MTTAAPAPPAAAEAGCTHCGAPLLDDQEWCLECGAARTLIHRPPDWRVPVAIIGAVVALVLVGAAIALVAISSDANRSASVRAATAPAAGATAAGATAAGATVPAASTPSATTTPAATATTPAATTTASAPPSSPAVIFPDWPIGLGGWTVVLGSSRSLTSADAIATRLHATGIKVGVLESSQHSRLVPGFWVVFSGRYPTSVLAHAAAVKLRALGQVQAHPRLVAPPGGQ